MCYSVSMLLSQKAEEYIKPHVGQPSNDYVEWLDRKNIPTGIKEILLKSCFKPIRVRIPPSKEYVWYDEVEINCVRFYTPKAIMSSNDVDETSEHSSSVSKIDFLFGIGGGISGDIWAINLNTVQVEVISHEETYVFDDEENVVVAKPVADSYSEFIVKAFEDKLPVDYYNAP